MPVPPVISNLVVSALCTESIPPVSKLVERAFKRCVKLVDAIEPSAELLETWRDMLAVVLFQLRGEVACTDVVPKVDDIPKDEVAVGTYTPLELPTRTCPYEGTVPVPVPPPVGKSMVAALATVAKPRLMTIAYVVSSFFI